MEADCAAALIGFTEQEQAYARSCVAALILGDAMARAVLWGADKLYAHGVSQAISQGAFSFLHQISQVADTGALARAKDTLQGVGDGIGDIVRQAISEMADA